MTLSTRRAQSKRAEAESAPAQQRRAIDPEHDPDVGYFRRRAMRLRRLGIKPIGPSGPPASEPPPEHNAAVIGEHNVIIRIELHQIDMHRETVAARLAALASDAGSFQCQELRAELRQLAELRSMIAADLDKPTTRDRDGRPLTDKMRAFLKARTAELRDSYWRSAESAAREGDHRRARHLRRDALRSRHLAEHEMHLREHLPGYGITPWS